MIFGTRTVHSKLESGEFFCPRCRVKRPCQRRRARSFFHVFIPLVPASGGQEYVRCDACKGDFPVAVLDHDPEAHLAQFEASFALAVRCVVVTMIAADGEIDPRELSRAAEVIRRVTQAEFPLDDIQGLATDALDGRVPISAALREVAPNINEHGKEMLVRIALDIAASDGSIARDEIELIERVANDLGMSAAHVQGILISAFAASTEEDDDASDEGDTLFESDGDDTFPSAEDTGPPFDGRRDDDRR